LVKQARVENPKLPAKAALNRMTERSFWNTLGFTPFSPTYELDSIQVVPEDTRQVARLGEKPPGFSRSAVSQATLMRVA
jgi:hypothetical protein